MCISLCILNYQSPFCKEYLSGPTAYNNAVQNNSYQLGKEKLFFSPKKCLNLYFNNVSIPCTGK